MRVRIRFQWSRIGARQSHLPREPLLRRFAGAAYFPEMDGKFSFLIALAALTTSYGPLLSSGLTRCAGSAPLSWWS